MSHGSETRVRCQHLTIRLSEDERAAIDLKAEAVGLTPGSYVRQIILGAEAPRPVRRVPLDRRELSRLCGLIGRLGNNVNQIARLGNCGEPVDAGALAATLGNLETMRDAVLRALGRIP